MPGLGGKSQATEAPWEVQVPYLTAGFERAGELLGQGMPAYYPEQTQAQFTQPELASQQGITDYVGSPAVQKMQEAGANQLLGTYNRANLIGRYGGGLMDYGQAVNRYGMTQGQYAGMTPFNQGQLSDLLAGNVNTSALAPVIGAMGRDVMSTLQGQVLPGIRSQQVAYQPGGSSRGDLVTSQAVQAANQRLIDNAQRMYSDAYSQAQGRRLPAAQMALGSQQAAQQLGLAGGNLGLQAGGMGLSALGQYPSIMQAPLGMYGALGKVGGQQRAFNQEAINQAMAKYNYQAMAPQQALQNYMAMISGNYGGQSTAAASPLSQVGQLASIAMALGGSDIHIKENIVPEAAHWKGFNVYTFNYIGDPKPRRGVMAQEVERSRPDAVYDIGGVKHVAYGVL